MSWAHYILQVNIYLIVFYGFYKFLLDKETYFNLNRLYLLSAGLLSAALPFLRFEWFISQPIAQPVYSGVGQMNDYISVAIVQDESKLTAGNVLAFLYLAGVLFFVVRLIIQLIAVRILLKRGEKGFAFSFFGKKVIDVTLPEFRTINSHEEIHIRQLHSLDVIFFEVLGIITWFNPVIYFYKQSIKNIHEYLADEAAAKFQGDKEQYALLLLSSAFGVTPSNLTNSFFNKSLIKKRIYMLHKQRSTKTAVLKYGLFLPLFAIALVMSSATIRKNEKIRAVAEKLPLAAPLNIIEEAVTKEVTAPGIDWSNLMTHLKKTVKFPTAAFSSQTQGFTMIKFVVKNGSPDGVAVISPALGSGTEAELMSKLLSYGDFNSIPDGNYALKAKFSLDGATTPIKNENLTVPQDYTQLPDLTIGGFLAKTTSAKNDPNDVKVYDFVSLETQPTFPGGMEKFYNYLKQNLRYPVDAKANKLEGKVFLSFIVEKDGSLMDIKVDRSLGQGTDEEAVRVLNASPKWQPGTQNGNAVRVKYNIPVSFNLTPAAQMSGFAADKTGSASGQVSDFVASPTQEEKIHDFVSLETQPTFPGGMAQFYEFLKRTVRYPKEAQDKNIQGKVFLSFVVEKNGELTNIKVDRKLGGGTDEEAIRVMKLSPHWKPGTQDKKPVRVKYNIPISFTLSK
jgi:TonB family protein